MKRYRLNRKIFGIKRYVSNKVQYIKKPCLGCMPDRDAIHTCNQKTYYDIPEQLKNKYNISQDSIYKHIGFWECCNCRTKSPIKGFTKLFNLIEDLDDVSNIEFKEEWHLRAFENKYFVQI